MLIRKARPDDAPAIARVHVDSWRTTYAGIVSSEFLAALSYGQRERMWSDFLSSPTSQNVVHVAEAADGDVDGFASAGPEREGDNLYKGEVYALYLLQSHQRQGIGSMLFRASAKELHRQGIASMLIWVLAANPARKFYEAAGGKYVRERQIEIGSQLLVEVAYGWDELDMRALLEHRESPSMS